MLYREGARQVLDTKWKLLDFQGGNSKDKYDLSQQDFYQLFAYGHKYQDGAGDMMMIYPRHSRFTDPLPCFHFDEKFRLWAVPFCIEKDQLISGEWESAFEALVLSGKKRPRPNGSASAPIFIPSGRR